MKQNFLYLFIAFYALFFYTHYDYILANNVEIAGPLIVAISICNIALDAAVATFLSGLMKKRWFAVAVCTAVWLLCMANVLYLRHFNTYVDITLIGEVRNFDILGESLLALTSWRDLAVSIVFFVAVYLIVWKERWNWGGKIKSYYSVGMALLALIGMYGLIAKGTRESFVKALSYITDNVCDSYTRGYMFGMTHYVGYDLSRLNSNRDILPEDEALMQRYFKQKSADAAIDSTACSRPPRNIIFYLMEGIQTDVLREVCLGDTVMPNLLALADSARYCNLCMESEVSIGLSSDGQLIYMTGMLPKSDQNTVNHYTFNAYPGLPTACKRLGMQTAMLLPTGRHIWRQEEMCAAYGIDSLYTTVTLGYDEDDNLTDKAINLLDDIKKKPFFLTLLNMTTHPPFIKDYDKRLKSFAEKNLADDKQGYYERANFFDFQLGRFIKALKKKGIWAETLVIIASDHHVPDYAKDNKRGKIPFIITGGYQHSLLQGHVKSEEVIYQSDLDPTLLGLLGIEQKWRGVGRNLFNSNSKRLTDEEKHRLSDMILETNWFAKRQE